MAFAAIGVSVNKAGQFTLILAICAQIARLSMCTSPKATRMHLRRLPPASARICWPWTCQRGWGYSGCV